MYFTLLLAILPLAFTFEFDTSGFDSNDLNFCLTSDPNCQFNDRPWSFVNSDVPDDLQNQRIWNRAFDYADAVRFDNCMEFQDSDFHFHGSTTIAFCKTCKPDWVYLARMQKYVKSAEGKVEDVIFIDKAFQPTLNAWNDYCDAGGSMLVPALNGKSLVSDKSRSFYRFFASSTCYSTTFCSEASSAVPLESKIVCKPHTSGLFPTGQFCTLATNTDKFAITSEMGCDGGVKCESIRFRSLSVTSRKNNKKNAQSTSVTKRLDLCVYAESSVWTW